MHSKLAKAVGALVSASFMVSMIPAMATAAVSYTTDEIDFTFSSTIHAGEEAISYEGIDFAVSGGAGSQVSGSGNRYFGVDGNIGGEETGAGTGIYTFSIAPDDIYEGCNIVGVEIEAYNFTGCQLVGDDWTYDEDERILAWEGDAPSVSLELVALSDNANHYFNFDSITVYVAVPVSEEVFRLFNEDTGEHLYSADEGEVAYLVEEAGWSNEGPCWVAPYATGTAVYRLFNESDGEHLYIADQGEISYLVDQGWKNEGVAFFSYDGEGGTPVYRVFDPNGLAFTHTYSIDEGEVAYLVDNGWRNEGEAFYGLPELQEAVATPEEAPVAEAPVLYE